MMEFKERGFTFTPSGNPIDCLRACIDGGLTGAGTPTVLELDRVPLKPVSLESLQWELRRVLRVQWDSPDPDRIWERFAIVSDVGIVKVVTDREPLDFQATPRLLVDVPFLLGTGRKLSTDWWRAYPCPTFSGHYDLGWMCAFKGDGHRVLTSRRFLDYGPWRLIRDEATDQSMLQFHDTEADEATALAQARPGHRFLMLEDEGCVAWGDRTVVQRKGKDIEAVAIPFAPEVLRPSHHDTSTRTSIVLVLNREVSFKEMREAAAVKRFQPYPGVTIDQVAFVFFDEAQAHRQLFDLWVRGLEVRAMTSSGERRLDDAFTPPAPPPPPDWVQRLRDREGY